MLTTALSAHEQFFAELHALPVYTDEDRNRLAVLACQGDQDARQKLIESFLHNVVKYATDLTRRFGHLSFLEIVQMGNMLLVEYIDRALWAENVCGYLLKTVKHQMYAHCLRHSSAILTPRDEHPHTLLSLDRPLTDESTTVFADIVAAPSAPAARRDCSTLYQALSQLSEERQELLAR